MGGCALVVDALEPFLYSGKLIRTVNILTSSYERKAKNQSEIIEEIVTQYDYVARLPVIYPFFLFIVGFHKLASYSKISKESH